MRRTDVVPPEIAVASGTAPVTPAMAAAPPADYSSASAANSPPPPPSSGATANPSFTTMVGATESVALPPTSNPWKFREQTGAWGDAAAEKLRGAVGSNPSLAGAINRIIRGSFMHREVYRGAAANPQLNAEALCVAGAIIVAGFVGLWFTGFGLFYSSSTIGMFIRLAVIRIVSWAAAVFAIQYAAKSLHQVNLPAAAWFRARVYAQAPSLLMIVPAIGMVSGIWAAICSVAAIHDLEGRDTVSAIIVAVIGGVAASLGVYLATAVLRSFF